MEMMARVYVQHLFYTYPHARALKHTHTLTCIHTYTHNRFWHMPNSSFFLNVCTHRIRRLVVNTFIHTIHLAHCYVETTAWVELRNYNTINVHCTFSTENLRTTTKWIKWEWRKKNLKKTMKTHTHTLTKWEWKTRKQNVENSHTHTQTPSNQWSTHHQWMLLNQPHSQSLRRYFCLCKFEAARYATSRLTTLPNHYKCLP